MESRRFRIGLICLLLAFCGQIEVGFGQEDTTAPYIKPLFGTIMPHFVGGDLALRDFIRKHLVYPDSSLQAKAEGKVYMSFVVTKNGNIRDVRIKRSAYGNFGYLFDQEALRLIRMMPSWEPGTKDKIPVNMRMEMPLNFHL